MRHGRPGNLHGKGVHRQQFVPAKHRPGNLRRRKRFVAEYVERRDEIKRHRRVRREIQSAVARNRAAHQDRVRVVGGRGPVKVERGRRRVGRKPVDFDAGPVSRESALGRACQRGRMRANRGRRHQRHRTFKGIGSRRANRCHTIRIHDDTIRSRQIAPRRAAADQCAVDAHIITRPALERVGRRPINTVPGGFRNRLPFKRDAASGTKHRSQSGGSRNRQRRCRSRVNRHHRNRIARHARVAKIIRRIASERDLPRKAGSKRNGGERNLPVPSVVAARHRNNTRSRHGPAGQHLRRSAVYNVKHRRHIAAIAFRHRFVEFNLETDPACIGVDIPIRRQSR